MAKEKIKDVRLSINGEETVISMHDSYLISEALRCYAKKECPNISSDENDVAKLKNLFNDLAW